MTKSVKIRILNEVHIMIIGLHGDHLEHFYNEFAVLTDNYFFNPKFQLGQWDGKIRYFGKDGKTYLYLLDKIIPQLKRFGYTIELDDVRETEAFQPDYITETLFEHINHLDTGEPIILRDYQVEGVNALIETGYGLCVAGTGSGKTYCCVALITAYDKLGAKSITIVPNQSLIRQTKRDYINCGLDTGEYSGTEKTLNHKHIVSTWQALKNNPKIMNTFDMVIVDECHRLKGNVLQKIICEHAAKMPYRFGFTGTLPKDPSSAMMVHIAVGPKRYEIPAYELIERGVLSTIKIDILQLEENLTKEYEKWCEEFSEEIRIGRIPTYKEFKDGYFPDYSAEKSYIHRKESRIEWIANLIQIKLDTSGNVLCLVDNISFGRRIALLIPGAIFVNGRDVKKESKRQEIYDLFKTRDDLIVIATVNIAGEGLSIDRIFNLITIDVGKSFIRVIQAIGRGLRKAGDKCHVSYTDICCDLKYGKKHLTERIKYYKEARYPHKKFKVEYNETLKEIK